MTKEECLKMFNIIANEKPINFTKEVLPMISDYLTENNVENSEKVINSLVQMPQLAQNYILKLIDYYCRKYNIFSVILVKENFQKTILYYE